MDTITVESDDFGGLSYKGSPEGALHIAGFLRPLLEEQPPGNTPNFISDFVFALETACQDAGLLDEHFNCIQNAG